MARKKISWRLGVAVWLKSGERCHYCGCRFSFVDDAEIDHVVPVSRGGTTELENLVLACASCNGSKGTMDAEEFLEFMNA